MKKMIGLAFFSLMLSAPAQAANLGLNLGLDNMVAPTGAAGSMGVSYYLNDKAELPINLAFSTADGAVNSLSVGYWMHGTGKIHSMMGGGLALNDLTGDLAVGANVGIGVSVDAFWGTKVRAVTGLAIAVTPDFTLATSSSNLSLHIPFSL
jgi:hypothetical protein